MGREDKPTGCQCRLAVSRAYRSMMRSGAPDCVALEVAVRVYRFHHPEVDLEVAETRVESWVVERRLQ